MNSVGGKVLAAMIAVSAASAAQNTIPFKQIEKNSQYSARLNPPDGVAEGRGYAVPAASSSSLSSASFAPVYKPPRTLSKSFFLVNGIHLGLAMLDVGMTQHCIADHHCREGNPMMPSSLGGQLGVDFGLVGSAGYISFRLKKEDSGLWWLTPTIGIVAHGAGVATGIAHR